MNLSVENESSGLTDAELMLASGRGDADAFRVLYRRISKVLYSVAVKIVGNESDAEELMQETFAELWKHSPTYDASRAKPLTFAVRIIRNRAIDRVRKGTRREEILRDSNSDVLSFTQSTAEPKADEAAEIGEKSEKVKRAMCRLSPGQREALDLAYFKGMSQSEIAVTLSEALGTVKSRIRRGLEKLRKEMEGCDEY